MSKQKPASESKFTRLSLEELNGLIYRVGTSIKNNTTKEVLHMTKEEAEFFYDRLVTQL